MKQKGLFPIPEEPIFFFFLFLLCFGILPLSSSVPESSPEKSALLDFKSSVSDPHGNLLSAWNPELHHCAWAGVACNSRSEVVSIRIHGGGGRGSSEDLSCSDAFKFPILGARLKRVCSGWGRRGKLVGKLSPLIGKLSKLRVLSLPFNDLGGEIPSEIWGLKELEVLDLQGNLFTGEYSGQFGVGLTKLRVLNLGFNRIHGEIPASISRFASLQVLNLAGNNLIGRIPEFVGSFLELKELNLAHNKLNGTVPFELGFHCEFLEHIDLSGNLLIGTVPPVLGNCHQLRTLSLNSNRFTGQIPSEFGQLKRLQVLDLSRNHFPDTLPTELTTTLPHVKVLWSPSANVESEVPRNARSLATADSEETASSTSAASHGLSPIEIASIVSASAIVSVLIVLVVLFFYMRKWTPNARVQVSEPKEIIEFVPIGVPLLYEDIVQATGNFNTRNCIGNGGFGATYKAEIAPGTLVAVKRLSVGRFQGFQQFHAEIKALGRVRHPHLVTLIGFHASETEMFLIYNYLPGGNLESFIRGRSAATVQWKILHKIAFHIARALAYLHDQCAPRILHRDVKPSNILLDDEFNAYLSDFGLARLLGTSETHATTGVAGTFGYVAPEYAMTCRVSEKADVYSYGVVLLELMSDKKALDPSFSSQENGFNIVSWASLLLRHGRAKEVFTAGLWESSPHDDLVEMLHLAITCTDDTLSTRPTMKSVVQRLRQIRPS
ncbi:unnamed protein product [Linum tenue]|uniref:non-specific serine/threonine protein kinase n=3 Tax=Linum tenue TaxID=586396 RepID=A0AAV0HZI9_9ROSI|nr:unnamed protein product [Linum tenue]